MFLTTSDVITLTVSHLSFQLSVIERTILKTVFASLELSPLTILPTTITSMPIYRKNVEVGE